MSAYQIGYVVGIILTISVAIILGLFIRKKRADRCNYDERQELVRGRGYRYGYYTMLLAIAALMYAYESELFVIPVPVALFFVLCVSILVSSVYCIFNDAFFSLNVNAKKYLIICGFAAAFNYYVALASVDEWSIGGRETNGFANLMVAILLTFVFIAIAVRKITRKSEEE